MVGETRFRKLISTGSPPKLVQDLDGEETVRSNPWSERLVSCREAYRIAFQFLDTLYRREGGQWDVLGGLLGSMAIHGSQIPSDRAILIDWTDSCARVLSSAESKSASAALRKVRGRNLDESDWPTYSLTGRDAYAATRQFLQDMHNLGWQGPDAVLAHMPSSAVVAPHGSSMLDDWIEAFHRFAG